MRIYASSGRWQSSIFNCRSAAELTDVLCLGWRSRPDSCLSWSIATPSLSSVIVARLALGCPLGGAQQLGGLIGKQERLRRSRQRRESLRPRTVPIGLIDKGKTRYRERLRIALRHLIGVGRAIVRKPLDGGRSRCLRCRAARWRLAFALSHFAVIP